MRVLLDDYLPRALAQSHRYQQNLRGRGIAGRGSARPKQSVRDLEGLIPELLRAMVRAPKGEATHVGV